MQKTTASGLLLNGRNCFRAKGCSAGYLVLLARTVCKRVPAGSGVVAERIYDLKAYRRK